VSERDRLEVLQARRDSLRRELERRDPRLDHRLEREVAAFRQTLTRREARPVAWVMAPRVSVFGLVMLFVAPLVDMVGSALGRRLAGEDAAAVGCLVMGAALVLAMLVPGLSSRLLHATSRQWRLLKRAEALLRR
jgi:hypothetical protein